MGTTRHWVFDYGMWVCRGGSPHLWQFYHWISGIHEMTWVDVRTEGVETINTSQDGIQHWSIAVDHEPE